MARMWYAFARDDGIPGSRWLRRVGGRHHTPVIATIVTAALSVAICLYAAAWFVVTSISTICLYLAYAIPIYLNLRNRWRGEGESMSPAIAAWSLGRWSGLINAIAIAWAIVITVVFVLPPNELVLWTMLAVGILLLSYWKLVARRSFRGPVTAQPAR
jgi:amino acid transporter